FYDNFLFNKNTKTIRTAIYLRKDIVNTAARKEFVFDALLPKVEAFEKATNLDVRISGMRYVRTLNAQNIVDELGKFIALALGAASLVFVLCFRSCRATFCSLLVVRIGAMWTFRIIGVLQYVLTVRTALIRTLIIAIGIPNCFFLSNPDRPEVELRGNKVRSL